MTMEKRFGVLVAGLILLLVEAKAVTGAEGFAGIADRNVFGLNPFKPEAHKIVVQQELPQISLQGLTTLLNSRQALLKIQSTSKPVATEVSCILSEGQARDGVMVRRIDMASGTVWLTNQGVEQVLKIKR